MTSKEALSDLSFLAIGDENHTIKCKETIEKDLDLLSRLVVENGLLKKDLKEYQAYIKKGVEEHYKEFMQDYDVLLEEYNEINKNYKRLKKDLLYLQQIGIGVYIFPNRKILGYDITDSPSEIELKKEILEDIIKNITEGLESE